MFPCPGFVCDGWNVLLVHPLINALIALYDVLFRDLGLAIVVLTVLIRLALYPMFLTQLRSQRTMQELQPAIAEIKRRYKDDRQKFAEEQMRLYRARGYNPASGCLPILLQMPILFGLYAALQQVGCGLGPPQPPPGWAGPDQYCPGLTHDQLQSVLYPFIGNPIAQGGTLDQLAAWLPWVSDGLAKPEPFPWKILAVLAGLTQFAASLMALPPKTPQTDDPMQKSMGMMVYYMPLITVWFAWTFPAGLSVYWVMTTLFSIVQQYLVSGWGKLGTYIPALELIPAPARPFAPTAETAPPPSPSPQGPAHGQQKRRKRRR